MLIPCQCCGKQLVDLDHVDYTVEIPQAIINKAEQ
jgi:hypothetical protein